MKTKEGSRATGHGRLIAVLALGVILGSACGTASPGSGAASTPDTDSPGTGPTGEVLGGSGDPADATPGEVTVTLSEEEYGPGDVITAVVANGLDRTIYAQDSKTDCTIAYLERTENGEWVRLESCLARRPPAVAAIGTERGRTVTIDPASSNFAEGAGSRLIAGTYRVAFTFSFRSGGVEDQVAFSAPFTLS